MSRNFIRYSRKKREVLIFCLLFTVIILIVYVFCEWRKSRREVLNLKEQLGLHERMVYVATEKLPKGTVLTKDKLDMQIRYSDYSEDKFLSESELGVLLSLDIEEGTCLMDFMVYEAGNSTREFYLEELEIPEHVKKGDRVDIRIRYGNAEEYVVLADKIIADCQTDGVVICLTETELLMISSAVTDTELFRKAKLYVVEYPEYVHMETSQVNYIANRDVLLLLGREKTEGESRTALEQRLLQSTQ